jgi:hypothetical protein
MAELVKRFKTGASSSGMPASEIAAAPLSVEDDYEADTDNENLWEQMFGPDDKVHSEFTTMISSDEGGTTPVAGDIPAKKVALCDVIMCSSWFSCEPSVVVSCDELWWLCESKTLSERVVIAPQYQSDVTCRAALHQH